MSYAFDTRLGEQLFELLPEVYRTRDKEAKPSGEKDTSDDLAKYLDAHGHLLDLIHATLEQQLKDILPQTSQEWLLSYFAKLLAADIVSPDSKGKHAEISNAVLWRQRKGTLKCVEEIAEAVGQTEVEIQEGFKRVAMTPRIGMPLMPTDVYDDTLELNMKLPSQAARHPAQPSAMVDLRRASRAVKTESTNPAARVSRFGDVRLTWRQANYHGTPCFPDSFDDVSRRTVDIRTPSATKGHYHHKRLLAYVPPPVGFFCLEAISLKWDDKADILYEHLIEEKEENGVWSIRNLSGRTVEISDNVTLNKSGILYRIEGLNFKGDLIVEDGNSLKLNRVEAKKVQVNISSSDEPVLTADNSLFETLSVGSGTAKINSSTILSTAFLDDVDAKDCILMGVSGTRITGKVQFSTLPFSPPFHDEKMMVEDCTSDAPIFFKHQTDLSARAVIGPNTPESICAGASDGGEMGYYHNGRKEQPIKLKGDFIGADALILPTNGGYPLIDLVFEGSVEADNGPLVLTRCAVKALQVKVAVATDVYGLAISSLDAKDCLFDKVVTDNGLARLEYCTVMETADCKYLQASDCIFNGSVQNVQLSPTGTDGQLPEFNNCMRYSAIPKGIAPGVLAALGLVDAAHTIRLGSNTLKTPTFIEVDVCMGNVHQRRLAKYGEPGYGVLAAISPIAVRFGAEDGTEVGTYHHKYYCLRLEATLDKIRIFLSVGIEPVLIQDTRLMYVWPELEI